MELRQLRSFCAVVETNSFSKAGKIVCLTQSSVSLHIQALEDELNICFFNRSKRERVLTEKGKTFYEYARKILALCDEATKAVGDVDGLAKGALRIGAVGFIGKYILPQELASFKGIYSCVRISLKIGENADIIEDVIRGGLEIGIVEEKVNRKELTFKHFIKEPLALIVPQNHPWSLLPKIKIEQLKEQPFLLETETSKTSRILEEILKEKLNVVMSLGNIEAVKKGVLSGIGVSIVPKRALENENLIKEIEIEGLDLSLNFYIIYNPNRFRSKIPELFIEHLLEK